jgi:hypothetical protein
MGAKEVTPLPDYFIGQAFKDELFNTDNEVREKACAWKIQSTMSLWSGLTNDAFDSFAERARAIGMRLVVSYCYKCRKLIAVPSMGPYVCNECRASLI